MAARSCIFILQNNYHLKRVLLFIIILAGFSLSSNAQSADAITVKKLNRKWLDAIVQEDSASLSRILADDFVLINPGGMRRSKADNIPMHIPGQQVTNIVIDSQDLRFLTNEVGDITVWTTNYITQGKEKMVLKICYMDIYQKRKNEWKAVAAHVTMLK
jgi:ketosteroid isomerase-like protein